MAIQLSAADERMIAEIEADAASKKTSKSKAKALIKEIKDAAAKRKTPKFNAQGQENKTPTKKPRKKVSKLVRSLKKGNKAGTLKPDKPLSPKQKLLQSLKDSRDKPAKPASEKPEAKKTEAKKTEAKKLSAESKPSTNAKIRRKKVNTSRGKPPKKTKVDVRRTGGPKFGAGNKTATDKPPAKPTVKPKVKASSSTVGPAGDRISPQSKKVPSKLLSRLATVGKGAARFAGPAGLAITGASLLASLIPENTKGGGIGGRKGQAGYTGVDPKKAKNKDKTGAATATSVTNASQTSSESTQGASSSSQSSSFGAAFRKAKDAGEKTFTWPKGGKSYSTATKDEVKKSGSKNLREHLNRLNKKKSK